jgi:hypothetical protein
LKLSRRFFKVLLIVTIVWAVISSIGIEEFRGYRAESDKPTPLWIVGLVFSGIMLFSTWAISGVVKKNLQICVALIGIAIAFVFFIAAITENIGYFFYTGVSHIGGGGYSIYNLNPFLHLGGGTIEARIIGDPLFYATQSSLSIGNLILYLTYGESISFSLMGTYLLTKKQYFKTHSIELLMIFVGAAIAIITFYCDFISLYDEPSLVVHRILTQWQKPRGMSIFPPSSYYFYPPGWSYVPLSLADLFSLYFPIAYLPFPIIEAFRYYRWKKKQKAKNAVF